jgi:predicted nucleotidyltransferase component of viral defense system
LIPLAYIQAWSSRAPWPDLRQVEQDLIICRALCDLFAAPTLAGKIAFRGGTAIHKLLFRQPLRYSEDIDLVQTQAAPTGPLVDAIRSALSWLGSCKREQAGHSMHLIFKFTPETDAQATLKLKIEINTREHKSFFSARSYPFAVDNEWYSAQANVRSFEPEELFGTKLRALLQRRKSRDLFDLHHGLEQLTLDADRLVACFQHYLAKEGHPISRAMAEERMLQKLTHSLTEDIEPLLPAGVSFDQARAIEAFNRVWSHLIVRLQGEAWKSSKDVIAELRSKKYPQLLI